MAYHALLTENTEVAKAQQVLDAERAALSYLPQSVTARFTAWESTARAAVADGKPIPPRPAVAVTEADMREARTRVQLAEGNLDDVRLKVADDVEKALFARQDVILRELAKVTATLADRSYELMTLGHTASLLDTARNLTTGPEGREHMTGNLGPVDVLKHVIAGGTFLDVRSATPGPAGGAR